jgi:hypothetical protein
VAVAEPLIVVVLLDQVAQAVVVLVAQAVGLLEAVEQQVA